MILVTLYLKNFMQGFAAYVNCPGSSGFRFLMPLDTTQLRHVRIKFSEGEQFMLLPQVFISISLDTSKETSIEINQQKN